MSIRGEHGPASKTGELVHCDVTKWRRAAGVLVMVNEKTVFRVDADYRSADLKDLWDFRQLVAEDVGDLFCKSLVGVLCSEGGNRESVLNDVVHLSFGGNGGSGRQWLEANDLNLFFERRAETW